MKRRLVVLAILISLTVPAFVRTQGQQGGMPASSQDSSAPMAPQPGGVDSQGIRNYLLGPGDTLDVRVFGQPDLNAIVEVDSDGNISSLPFLEMPVPARCRTEKEVQKDIAKAYAKYLKNPQVSVRIQERKSRQPATVFGAVRQPTRVQMQRKVRLNELMAVSGGFTERASGTIEILHTEPLMCPGPGEEALATIDGDKLPRQIIKLADLKAGKQEANPIIRPGDYITVTEAEPIYIIGSVTAPQGIYLRDQLTLSRALAMVGGARKEAKISDILIYRQKPGQTDQERIHIDYNKIKKNEVPDFFLQAFDVIEVPEAGLFSSGRIVPTLMSAVTGSMSTMLSNGGTSIANRVIY
jgi:polysaccharide export outer membrane protein